MPKMSPGFLIGTEKKEAIKNHGTESKNTQESTHHGSTENKIIIDWNTYVKKSMSLW